MVKPSDFRVDCRAETTKWSWLHGSYLEYYVTDLRTGMTYPRDYAPSEMRTLSYDEIREVKAVDHTGTFRIPRVEIDEKGKVRFYENDRSRWEEDIEILTAFGNLGADG